MDELLIRFGMLKPEATHVERVCSWFLVWAVALFIGALALELMGDTASTVILGKGAVLIFVGLFVFKWGAGTQEQDEQERRKKKLDQS